MKTKNITVTLEKAKEWYNSDNAELKEVALQAFSREELEPFDFTKVKTFEDALRALNYSEYQSQRLYTSIIYIRLYHSKASAAMTKLNIIRRALNKGYDLHLTKNADGQNYTWYPYFRFVTESSTYYDDALKSGEYKKLGKITSEGVTYNVLCGCAIVGGYAGLGGFSSNAGGGNANASFGFLGCATKEIANHFGEHFGMLIMEAMYGDMIDFSIVEQ